MLKVKKEDLSRKLSDYLCFKEPNRTIRKKTSQKVNTAENRILNLTFMNMILKKKDYVAGKL